MEKQKQHVQRIFDKAELPRIEAPGWRRWFRGAANVDELMAGFESGRG